MRPRPLSILFPLLVAGCLGGPVEEQGEAPLDGATPGPEWVRCWIVPDAGEDPSLPQDQLFCQWSKPAADAPVTIAHVFVQAVSGGHIVETQMLERWPGEPVQVMNVAPSEYPVKVAVQLLVGGRRPVGMEAMGDLRAGTTFASAAAAPVETPWIVAQPFETWAVTIEVQSLLFEGWLHRVDVPLAPLFSPYAGSLYYAAGRMPLARQGDTLTLTFAAPPGTTTIEGDARLDRADTRTPFVLDGPGAYVATATGVARVPVVPPPPPSDVPATELPSGGESP